MKFAVFTVSTPAYTPQEVVKKLKEVGYDGVEWRVMDEDPSAARAPGFWSGNKATLPFTGFEEHAAEYRALAEGAGLEVPSLGTYVSCDNPDAADQVMRGAKAMGVPQLRIQVPKYDGIEPFRPIWDRAREQYKRIAELAEQNGVKALLELHHRTICPSASSGRMFLDGLNPEHVGAIHDAGNMVHEGYETHRLSLEMLGPYLAHIHIKNARWFPVKTLPDKTVEWQCQWAPIHRGIIDMRALFTAMRAVGYDGWVTLEDFSTDRKLDERLPENLAYLKAIVAEHEQSPA